MWGKTGMTKRCKDAESKKQQQQQIEVEIVA